MQFDSENKIVALCARGIELEGGGKREEAAELFAMAWEQAGDDHERLIAAHYLARHQKSVEDKLKWDETALRFALKIDDDNTRAAYPSLYLNIAKCHEDIGDPESALTNYRLAFSFCSLLPEDGYGKMIKGGVAAGIERIMKKQKKTDK